MIIMIIKELDIDSSELILFENNIYVVFERFKVMKLLKDLDKKNNSICVENLIKEITI